ncbi:alpha/beta fold hydrolase [Nocardia spumae]|uniref:alpha/beta fold hydrolase n=1 Tax=Nocardia spumae TaxID=2887190 RepID=UPI001D1431C3|nr:alpha/beta hydrolase [Nocardia spumae]
MVEYLHRERAVVYDRGGRGDPVVLLHNAGAQRRIWDDQFEVLRRDHEVFALDLPGYGESEQPRGYRLADYVEMLGGFLDAHRLDEVALIGNCLGSATSLSYAMGDPARVRGLILVNPLTWNTVRRGDQAPLMWFDRFVSLAPLARRLALPGPVVSMIVTNQLGPRGRRRKLQNSPRLQAYWRDRGRLFALDRLVQDFPAFAALDEFEPGPEFPPICTVWGRRNRILSARAGARLDETLRPRTRLVLDDCGHLPMVEDPDTVTAAITTFLAGPGTAHRAPGPGCGGTSVSLSETHSGAPESTASPTGFRMCRVTSRSRSATGVLSGVTRRGRTWINR